VACARVAHAHLLDAIAQLATRLTVKLELQLSEADEIDGRVISLRAVTADAARQTDAA